MPLGYPDGVPRSFANQFASNTMTATSTTIGGSTFPNLTAVGFGFNASIVKLCVDVGTMYVNFGTTGAATTADFKLTSGDGPQDFYDFGVGFAGMAFAATSTANSFRLGAWG